MRIPLGFGWMVTCKVWSPKKWREFQEDIAENNAWLEAHRETLPPSSGSQTAARCTCRSGYYGNLPHPDPLCGSTLGADLTGKFPDERVV